MKDQKNKIHCELLLRRWRMHFGQRSSPPAKLLRLWARYGHAVSPDQLICSLIEHSQFSLLCNGEGNGDKEG